MNKTPGPIPQGKYVPAKRSGNLVFTAGMTPRRNGELIMTGKVTAEKPLEFYREAVVQAVSNALIAARNLAAEDERVVQVVYFTVYVCGEEGYTLQTKLADLASDYLVEELGEAGVGARAAIGIAGLPGDAPVEIQLVVELGK